MSRWVGPLWQTLATLGNELPTLNLAEVHPVSRWECPS
jgi:hypothetical protein